MRPDASLLVRKPGSQEVWLHFDAKYRFDWSVPFETGEVDEEEESERVSGTSKRTDLLKMHAYRDAIRDSGGPTSVPRFLHAAEFAFAKEEFLPGLGAFPLRPDESQDDTARLAGFVSRAIRHALAPERAIGARPTGRRAPMEEQARTRREASAYRRASACGHRSSPGVRQVRSPVAMDPPGGAVQPTERAASRSGNRSRCGTWCVLGASIQLGGRCTPSRALRADQWLGRRHSGDASPPRLPAPSRRRVPRDWSASSSCTRVAG